MICLQTQSQQGKNEEAPGVWPRNRFTSPLRNVALKPKTFILLSWVGYIPLLFTLIALF